MTGSSRVRTSLRLPPSVWLLATLLCHLPAFAHPMMDDDEGVYAAVAALMNAGGRLYASGGVDNKFPGIYWLYALAFKAFGAYSMVAIHVLAVAFVVGTAAVLGFIARRISEDERAFGWAALFYGVFSASYYPKMLAANTEVFMMLPLAGSIAMALPGRKTLNAGSEHDDIRWITSGALLVVACLFKQVALLNATVLLVQIYLHRPRRSQVRHLTAAVIGAVFAAAVAMVVVVRTASVAGLWHWAIWGLISYSRGGWSVSTVARGLVAFSAFVGSCLALCLLTVLSYRRPRPGDRGRPGPVLLAWCLSSIVGVAIGGRFFGHYFLQLIAPLAVLAALQVLRLATDDARWAVGTLAMTALPALGFGAWAVLADPLTGRFGSPVPDYIALGRYVESVTAPSDRIFVWGNFAPIYVTAMRLPATRFVGFLRGLDRGRGAAAATSWDVGDDVWSALREDWADHPPEIVVDTSTGDYSDFRTYPPSQFPAVQELIHLDFVRIGVVQGATIYRKKTGAAAKSMAGDPPSWLSEK